VVARSRRGCQRSSVIVRVFGGGRRRRVYSCTALRAHRIAPSYPAIVLCLEHSRRRKNWSPVKHAAWTRRPGHPVAFASETRKGWIAGGGWRSTFRIERLVGLEMGSHPRMSRFWLSPGALCVAVVEYLERGGENYLASVVQGNASSLSISILTVLDRGSGDLGRNSGRTLQGSRQSPNLRLAPGALRCISYVSQIQPFYS
jgi:hypothetical protein